MKGGCSLRDKQKLFWRRNTKPLYITHLKHNPVFLIKRNGQVKKHTTGRSFKQVHQIENANYLKQPHYLKLCYISALWNTQYLKSCSKSFTDGIRKYFCQSGSCTIPTFLKWLKRTKSKSRRWSFITAYCVHQRVFSNLVHSFDCHNDIYFI